MTEMAVHPVADLFPMLAADELEELAVSIKEHGLDQPIVLDTEGRILDGRNRLAACKIARVEPRFVTYEAGDADDYALRSGITRRHLTTGARAIIAAKAARLNGRGHQADAAKSADLHITRITEANLVLDWCDATVVKAVMAGTKPLSKAVEEARQLKKEDAARESKKDRLRESAPDLLARVGEGLDLDEALGALDAREEKARQEAERAQREAEAKAEAERREAEARASEEERARRLAEEEHRESLERDRDRIRMVVTGWSTVRDLILPDPDGERAVEILAGLGENDRLAIKRIVAELTE